MEAVLLGLLALIALPLVLASIFCDDRALDRLTHRQNLAKARELEADPAWEEFELPPGFYGWRAWRSGDGGEVYVPVLSMEERRLYRK